MHPSCLMLVLGFILKHGDTLYYAMGFGEGVSGRWVIQWIFHWAEFSDVLLGTGYYET